MAALLTPAVRRRFAELGPQDYGDEAREVVVAHFFLPGTGWDWYAVAFDDDGGVPQLFCLVRGQEIEFGYVALAKLEAVRSPLGLAVERDEHWQECSLADLRQRLSTPPRWPKPVGYWRRGRTGGPRRRRRTGRCRATPST